MSATLVAILIGMAKPIPSLPLLPLTIAELMPMTSPFMFTSWAPELRRLIGASVWLTGAYSLLTTELRSRAEMMPVVTLWLNWKGDPTAMTDSPTFRAVLSPLGRGG